MQDYVCSSVQLESELVGRELVAGHPVGLKSVLEFCNHLLHASSTAIAFRVYETGPPPLEVRHDISDVCPETVDLDFDKNLLLMLPGIGLVHKRMEHAHLFTGGLVRCNRSVKPVGGCLLELHVPCKSRNEVDAILLLCCPVHEVLGAEMGVSPYYYLSMFPLLAELGYQLFEPA